MHSGKLQTHFVIPTLATQWWRGSLSQPDVTPSISLQSGEKLTLSWYGS